MKILCIGEALIDMICTDTGRSLSEGEHFLKKPGGAPTNVAAAIAALGGDVLLAAKVGDDPFGRQLVDVMKDFGVSTIWMSLDKSSFTTFAFVSLMQDGGRDFVFNRGADGQLSTDDVQHISLGEVSIVHFGSATAFLPGPLQEAYVSLLHRAREGGQFISFDPNYRNLLFGDKKESFIEQSWTFLKQCHFFKVSDEEAMLLTHQSSVVDAATILAEGTSAVFAITLGKAGTLLVHAGKTATVPSIAVQAVDTTGAGDAFVGAVLHQLSNFSLPMIQAMDMDDWKKIIANANKAGARTCEYMGAMEAFKHLSRTIFD
ncbi:carbohydrate kinase family protein [Flavisolibacter ginsenosidimutans]|uniref:Carbohydrate kinase n=1 Tax=Flavisolibacter ginsenosidimutans TaxID=661481 RepID=A0A5B8UFN7_9BACT|nr:carbohydrate kinase [Flavisolibacter ginsenosidimutans]QEC55487.1 carbohydrate kinase [Flavisolibacter ginsenosidimutans]